MKRQITALQRGIDRRSPEIFSVRDYSPPSIAVVFRLRSKSTNSIVIALLGSTPHFAQRV
jgi:hypothetical protein